MKNKSDKRNKNYNFLLLVIIILAFCVVFSTSPKPVGSTLNGFTENAPPIVVVISPNGGEKLEVWKFGSPNHYDVVWNASDPDGDSLTFDILLSINGGKTYDEILASNLTENQTLVSSNRYSYRWYVVSNELYPFCKIKVIAYDNNVTAPLSGEDESDKNFSILYIIPRPPAVYLYAPSGGEVWSGTQEIRWQAVTPDQNELIIYIQYSNDGGKSWCNLTGTEGIKDTGKYLWDTTTVPNGERYMVRIIAIYKDYPESTGGDISQSTFIISNVPTPILNISSLCAYTFEPITFDASVSIDDAMVISYLFDFGDGNVSGWVNHSSLTYSYLNDGIYIVKVKVKNNLGIESDWANVTITVLNNPPLPIINVDRDLAYVWQKILFSSVESKDLDGVIIEYVWDFGDGEIGYGIDAVHKYKKPGTYTITLTVKDNDGAEANTTFTIAVKEPKEWLIIIDWLLPIMLIILTIAGIVLLIYRKK